MRRRTAAAVAAALGTVLVALGPMPARAVEAPSSTAVRRLPRVTFVAAPGSSLLVHGTYPRRRSPCVHPVRPVLHARYPGTIEVGKDGTGHLFVIGVMPFEQYVDGLGEVPPTWPMPALEAQAIAARSYALANLAYPDPTGRALGYQLCATDACQVYTGLGVSAGPNGARWVQAVSATSHQALLWNGRPADTVYFSTSNGHTYSNAAVFGSAPLPYLKPVREADDGASPLSHWRTSVTLDDVARFLRAAGAWSAARVSSVSGGGARVVVRGRGTSAVFDTASFAADLNAWASCLAPDRYPTANAWPGRHTLGTALPQTVPSKWFSAVTKGRRAVLTGRGWGHGVGMVQWGAEGKAARGMTTAQILSFYYGGLKPATVREPPTIRIGIATGLSSVRIQGLGTVSVHGADPGAGPWLVTGGRFLRVRHGAAPAPLLDPGTVDAPASAPTGGRISVTVHAPQAEIVQLRWRPAGSASGAEVALGPARTLTAGTHAVAVALPAAAAGTGSIQAVVTDGVDTVRTSSHPLRVEGVSSASPTPSGSGSGTMAAAAAIVVGGSVVAVIAVAAFVTFARRRRRRGD